MLFCFNPRSPCGERRISSSCVVCPVKFQSTLPLRGATVKTTTPITTFELFQSTLPLRGATICPGRTDRSNHNFNPRSPCGERQTRRKEFVRLRTFQSTLPLWGATSRSEKLSLPLEISIHAPPVGSDENGYHSAGKNRYFNPRSPCGERLLPSRGRVGRLHFNPRSPCGERLL